MAENFRRGQSRELLRRIGIEPCKHIFSNQPSKTCHGCNNFYHNLAEFNKRTKQGIEPVEIPKDLLKLVLKIKLTLLEQSGH